MTSRVLQDAAVLFSLQAAARADAEVKAASREVVVPNGRPALRIVDGGLEPPQVIDHG